MADGEAIFGGTNVRNLHTNPSVVLRQPNNESQQRTPWRAKDRSRFEEPTAISAKSIFESPKEMKNLGRLNNQSECVRGNALPSSVRFPEEIFSAVEYRTLD
jgi:hypothetical protein